MKNLSNFCSIFILLSLVGCSTYGVIDNSALTAITVEEEATGYSRAEWLAKDINKDLDMVIAFSGGGTRAAALSYGVLKGLRDTTVKNNGTSVRLLDQVDSISSVSGGSFTAAYYGLNGDGIFDTFKEAFLLRDVQSHLFWGLANPIQWFRSGGRTEMAVRYYDKTIFHDAKFADFKKDGPFIVINASGLGNGTRFSFVQEYFNLICSDLNTFPVSKAVTASSAVPVLFQPIVLEKYPDCGSSEPEWLKAAKHKAKENDDPYLTETVKGFDALLHQDRLKYVHLVDGGITDNLGLQALHDLITLSGGAKKTVKEMGNRPPKHFVIISVNSSINPILDMDLSNVEPSISETLGAISSVELHRYNTATIEQTKVNIKKWADAVSTPGHQVKTYFISIGIENIVKSDERVFFNKIPTSFGLSEETVDRLINAGVQLLHDDPEYQRLVSNLEGEINVEQ